jgi:hypothetical protein
VLVLLGQRQQLRLTDVSQYLGVASSTAHRLLAMLSYRERTSNRVVSIRRLMWPRIPSARPRPARTRQALATSAR